MGKATQPRLASGKIDANIRSWRALLATLGILLGVLAVIPPAQAAPESQVTPAVNHSSSAFLACWYSIRDQLRADGGNPSNDDITKLADDYGCVGVGGAAGARVEIRQRHVRLTPAQARKAIDNCAGCPAGFPGPKPVEESIVSETFCAPSIFCRLWGATFTQMNYYNGTWVWEDLDGYDQQWQTCTDYWSAGVYTDSVPVCSWGGHNPGSAHALWSDMTWELCSGWKGFDFCIPKNIGLSDWANGSTTIAFSNS
jgi:hypothetical protein